MDVCSSECIFGGKRIKDFQAKACFLSTYSVPLGSSTSNFKCKSRDPCRGTPQAEPLEIFEYQLIWKRVGEQRAPECKSALQKNSKHLSHFI